VVERQVLVDHPATPNLPSIEERTPSRVIRVCDRQPSRPRPGAMIQSVGGEATSFHGPWWQGGTGQEIGASTATRGRSEKARV
jgi:hypothetical protein